MKTKTLNLILAAALLTLAGCSSAPAKYTYEVDPALAQQPDNLTRTSAYTGHVVWLNPPLKRVAVDEKK